VNRGIEQPARSVIEQELTRRGFVVGAAGAGIGLGVLAQAIGWLRAAGEAFAQAGQPGLSPNDPAVRATMAAFADTIVPGPAGGADTRPGAIEAGALDELYEPFYGAAPSFPVVHNDLQLATPLVLERPASFDLDLPYADRERVLADRITAPGSGGTNPNWVLYQGAAILVYTSYYGTAQSDLGARTIHFPPRSDGYWPRHSYWVRFRGMTRRGNPS
jgi:hypothetical protein